MAITINVSASDLRAAYLPGRVKTGEVIPPTGITYCGSPITRIVFGRYDRVEYWNEGDHFATWQDVAAIDD